MKVLALILLFPLQSFSYSKEDIKLTSFEFRRYLKPQLNSIVSDFENLLVHYNPKIEHYKSISKSLTRIQKKVEALPLECEISVHLECKKEIKSIIKLVEKILKDKKIPFSNKSKDLVLADQFLTVVQLNQNMDNSLISLYFYLNKTYLSLNSINKTRINKEKIQEYYMNIFNTINLVYLESLPDEVKNSFLLFWTSFLKITTQNILPFSNQDLFVTKINDLNIALNQFLMFMEKRNPLVDSKTKTLVNIIQRRWNNCLKISLK